jgi:guanylate kinase
MSGKLFVISAPSGAGKTTLVQHSLERLRESCVISRVVTYTTKEPREGEAVQGVDYHFISQAEFEKKIGEGFFIEWSSAYGHYYGSPSSLVEYMAKGHSFILIVDRAGAGRIKEAIPEAVLIWIYTSSIEVLKKRLIARGGDSPEQIEKRLALAVSEIEQETVRPSYNFHVLNEDFYESVEKLCEIFKLFLN